LCDGDGQVI